MTLGLLAIRADANHRIGLGHAMRCFALAEAWIARGGTAMVFSESELPDAVARRFERGGVGRQALPDGDDGSCLAHAAEGADWLVVDGPFANPRYLEAASQAGPVLAIDDVAAQARYPADLILNQNLHADLTDYTGKTEAPVLAGPSYALLRKDICGRVKTRLIAPVARSVLVLVGGSDPGGHLPWQSTAYKA